ncbi:RNA polymerase sigma factor [Acidicapsa ligni]|uniref:RNA polymerase sigma factor n=1 Tax=Acidicapsa ligni TaxID=542300 RepID=UPI0021DFF8A4|nr:sigma-70 family RNA polymerase sigma factor [Acidicapsa ligni]
MSLTTIIETECIVINFTDVCDERLVAYAKKGNHHAYAELCNRHSKQILGTIQRITRNFEDSEDALQESLMKAYLYLSSFDERSAFSTWLTRIAINSALMMLRKKRRHQTCSLDSASDAEHTNFLEIVEDSEGPEQLCISRDVERRLKSAIRRLSPNLREVVELHQLIDTNVKEIANTLGLTEAATKSRLLRARISLRASMARHARYLPPSELTKLASVRS